jgi:hypothetical protein
MAEAVSTWAEQFDKYWSDYVSSRTTEQLQDERESLERDFADYADIGQGISTKETIRYNKITDELHRRGVKVYCAGWVPCSC